jgi:hypothetical protein
VLQWSPYMFQIHSLQIVFLFDFHIHLLHTYKFIYLFCSPCDEFL